MAKITLRQYVVALIIGLFIVGGMLSFNIDFIGGNGGTLPAQLNSTYQNQIAQLNSLQSSLGSSTSTATGNFTSNLQNPSSLSGFFGNFYVFGGIISSFFTYIFAIPSITASLLGTFELTPIIGEIVISIASILLLIVGVDMLFNAAEYVGKSPL